MEKLNIKAQEEKLKFWNGFTDAYETVADKFTIQGTLTCAVMTNMQNLKRTIEVGCGPGKHSLLLAKTMLSPQGGVLVSCDFSTKMIMKLIQNYTSPHSDYSLVDGNKARFVLNTGLTDKYDIEQIVKGEETFRKFVFRY